MTSETEAAIRTKVAQCRHWHHTIEVAPGISTPGRQDSARLLANLDKVGFPADLTGKRVLDVGVRDGFFSFAAEARGGTVTAVDYAEPTVTGFSIASEILNSRVTYHVDNVYALTPERYGTFDVVLFLGLIYHLRNPLQALDRLRSLCKPGALLFVETQLMADPLTPRLSRLKRLKNLLQGKKEQETACPIWQFVPGKSLNNDGTNCWIPTLGGLTAVLRDAEFTVQDSLVERLRGLVAARACTDPEAAHFRNLDNSKGLFQKDLNR